MNFHLKQDRKKVRVLKFKWSNLVFDQITGSNFEGLDPDIKLISYAYFSLVVKR